jgi:catechol 2,3-dioxygenase-like lactoylglutathione lyase family enzyme
MIPLLAVALAAVASPAPAPRVVSVAIVVKDRAAERAFYTEALGFRFLASAPIEGGRVDRLALGSERVDLVHYDRDGAPIAPAARSDDRDFQHLAIIVSDMDRAWRHVSRFAIRKVSQSPQVLPRSNPAAGGIAAVYFRDPEGHPLELLHFPAGKGSLQWHASAPLFLGIDHTAIAVTDSAASTRFYEALGLTVRGHSDNFGIEQQRLSGVRGAHVAITGLRLRGAPGIEFLQYLSPVRPQPPERARAFDRIATRTVLLEPTAHTLCATMPTVAGSAGGCLVRDPDGHLVELRGP